MRGSSSEARTRTAIRHTSSWISAIERRITLRGHQWALRVGVDNITNHFNPTTVNANIASDRFGQFYGGQDRLLIARLRWLGRSK